MNPLSLMVIPLAGAMLVLAIFLAQVVIDGDNAHPKDYAWVPVAYGVCVLGLGVAFLAFLTTRSSFL